MTAVTMFPEQGLLVRPGLSSLSVALLGSHPQVNSCVGSGTVLATQMGSGHVALASAVTRPRSNCWDVIEQTSAVGFVCTINTVCICFLGLL